MCVFFFVLLMNVSRRVVCCVLRLVLCVGHAAIEVAVLAKMFSE